jgi:acetyltransferase-like isoleucine patch superfamily enzyme
MKAICVPTSDVNSESAVLVAWKVAARALVRKGDSLAELETSKAILELEADADGYLLPLCEIGARVALGEPIAQLFPRLEELERFVVERAQARPQPGSLAGGRATDKARARALELGVDLGALRLDRVITVKDVEQSAQGKAVPRQQPTLMPLAADPGVERVLLLGGGLGATQVIEIFRAGKGRQRAVAILDDNPDKWNEVVYGVTVIGDTTRLRELKEKNTFDSVVIAISTSVRARAVLRKKCEDLGIPLGFAIDPSARIASDAVLGPGNVVCAFCHIGTSANVGKNNFLSAYNSFDHHSVLGNDISTGPGCQTSACVTLGDQVRLGTGIFIEPYLTLGANVSVASGSIILTDVPDDHSVKARVMTTSVVPNSRTR